MLRKPCWLGRRPGAKIKITMFKKMSKEQLSFAKPLVEHSRVHHRLLPKELLSLAKLLVEHSQVHPRLLTKDHLSLAKLLVEHSQVHHWQLLNCSCLKSPKTINLKSSW